MMPELRLFPENPNLERILDSGFIVSLAGRTPGVNAERILY